MTLFITLPHVFAGDEGKQSVTWLKEFFAAGIHSAYAEYSFGFPPAGSASQAYVKRRTVSVSYNAVEKNYNYTFQYEYRDDWNILTQGGKTQPPPQLKYHTASRVQPWTNIDGIGKYTETYERLIPNWVNLNGLDSLMILQCKLNNPSPAITGTFNEDELKLLKKLQKSNDSNSSLWQCFEYDKAGNVTEISKKWMNEFKDNLIEKKKNIAEYILSVRNQHDQVVFLEVLMHESDDAFIEGISFQSGDKKCKIFSFELNRMLNKFVPDLVADPDGLIVAFCAQLNTLSPHGLSRFETVVNN